MKVRNFVSGRGHGAKSVRLVGSGDVLHVEHIAPDGTTTAVDEYGIDEVADVVAQLKAAGYQETSGYAEQHEVPGVRPLAGAELDAASEVTPDEMDAIRDGLVPELRDLLDAS